MQGVSFAIIAAWLLAVAFLAGGIVNLLGSASVRADYRRWGYPDGFHLVTGILQSIAAVMIAIPAIRLWGLAIAAIVCFAAALTLIRAREYAHLPPSIVLLIIIVVVATLS